MFAFVVFVSVFRYQEIGWKERLRNDLFCVEWDVNPQLNSTYRHTDKQTTLRATSVATGRKYALRAGRCGLEIRRSETELPDVVVWACRCLNSIEFCRTRCHHNGT